MHVSRPSYYSIPSASRPSRLTLARAKLWRPAIILISILLSHRPPLAAYATFSDLNPAFTTSFPASARGNIRLSSECKLQRRWQRALEKCAPKMNLFCIMSLLAFDRIDRVAIRESRLNETHDVKRMYAVGGWSKECTVVQCPQPWNFMKKGFNISLYFGIWIIPSKVIGILFDIWKLRKIVRSNA
jgi:hypothetical protein